MQVIHRSGIAGARRATGPTIVIDVFRAFSAAAYAFDAGAEKIVLAEGVDEAIALAAAIPGSVMMGEDGGIRPDEFDLGNSPGEIVAQPVAVAGKTIVHRSSSGTRCARVAFAAGAAPIYVASLVVASATVRAMSNADRVTIVAAGLGGIEPADEDLLCAELMALLFDGGTADPAAVGEKVGKLDRATVLREAEFTHPDDVALCTAVDRFGFAMRAEIKNGLLLVRALAP